MIVLHERMNEDAEHVKTVIEDLFEIPVSLVEENLDQLFTPIPQFQGYYYVPKTDLLLQRVGATITVILTPRDIYGGDKSKTMNGPLLLTSGNSACSLPRALWGQITHQDHLLASRGTYICDVSL